MNAIILYERASDDRGAEIAADEAALSGAWAKFASISEPAYHAGVSEIPSEAKASIDERRNEDRELATQILVSKCFPYGLIEKLVDEWYPDPQ